VGSVLANRLLEARINSTFADHISTAIAPAGVTVSASDGRVTLTGITCSGGLRGRAETLAQGVPGVCHIDNRIVSVPSRSCGFLAAS
jgi:osmotically-inducible protein OsmY